ncbi:MAG: membrane integrity-associated transporter subunit PqiC [Candidatus Obscuribacterales bacterium]|nr:membrane integrity-associated transporter subunit PqiC [Steroidobacteraceae bacterium]
MTVNLRRLRAVVIACPLLLTMTACGLLETKVVAPAIFVLAPVASAANSSPVHRDVDLVIAVPVPMPGLDTERIETIHDARRLDYYQEAVWGATAPHVVQALLVASLQNQNQFRSVTAEQARVSATHLLDLQLRDFQAEYSQAGGVPTVRVTLIGIVIRLKDRKLLASFPATISVRADENRLSAVIAAFESAAQQVAVLVGEQSHRIVTGDN